MKRLDPVHVGGTVGFVLLIAFALFFPKNQQLVEIKVGDTAINVEIADTPEERERGLSGRDGLKEGEGLLFVLDEAGTPGFWMKDMDFDIDIIWIGEDKVVLAIDREVEPSTFPEIFAPPEPVKYVLEVPAGFSDTASINVGDILIIGQ